MKDVWRALLTFFLIFLIGFPMTRAGVWDISASILGLTPQGSDCSSASDCSGTSVCKSNTRWYCQSGWDSSECGNPVMGCALECKPGCCWVASGSTECESGYNHCYCGDGDDPGDGDSLCGSHNCNWMTSSNGDCCVYDNGQCNPSSAPVCGSQITWRGANCPAGQMALCNNGVQCVNPDNYDCVHDCDWTCPSGEHKCTCSSPGAHKVQGSCQGCNNPYWGCCCPGQTTTTVRTTTTTTTIPETCDATDENNNCYNDDSNGNGRPCDCIQDPVTHAVICDEGVDEGWTYELFEDNELTLDSAKFLDENKNVINGDVRGEEEIEIPSDSETYYIDMGWQEIWGTEELGRARECNAFSPGDSVYCHTYNITFYLNIPDLYGRIVSVEVRGLNDDGEGSWEDTGCSYTSPGEKFCSFNEALLTTYHYYYDDEIPDLGQDIESIEVRLRLEPKCDFLCSNLGYEYETCDETVYIPSYANGQWRYEGGPASAKGGDCSNYCYCYNQLECEPIGKGKCYMAGDFPMLLAGRFKTDIGDRIICNKDLRNIATKVYDGEHLGPDYVDYTLYNVDSAWDNPQMGNTWEEPEFIDIYKVTGE